MSEETITAQDDVILLQSSWGEIEQQRATTSGLTENDGGLAGVTYSTGFETFTSFVGQNDYSIYGQTSAPNSITVSSEAELNAALLSLRTTGGEILLEDGMYGKVSIVNYAPDQPITIASVDGVQAEFTDILVRDSSNIVFRDITIDHPLAEGEPDFLKFVNIDSSSNIAFVGSEFHGSVDGNASNDGIGMFVTGSTGVILQNNEMHNLNRGAVFSYSSELLVSDNYLHDIRSDGVDFAAVENVVIEGNYFRDFYPDLEIGDHADFIQFWTANADDSSHVLIRNNVMLEGQGGLVQGIFIESKQPEYWFNDFTIEGNLYNGSMSHGITAYDLTSGTIANNTIVGLSDSSMVAGINLVNASSLVEVYSNVSSRYLLPETVQVPSPNITIDTENPNSNYYIGKLFVNPGAEREATVEDFAPLPGGPLDDGYVVGAVSSSVVDFAIAANQEFGTENSLQVDLVPILGADMVNAEYTFWWNLGDGTVLEGQSVTHRFESGGLHTIELTILDSSGGVVDVIRKDLTLTNPEVFALDFENNANDSSEQGISGNWVGPQSYESGLSGLGAQFTSETGAFIAFDPTTALGGMSEFTLQFDFLLSDVDGVARQRPIWLSGTFGVEYVNSSDLVFLLWNEDGSVGRISAGAPNINDGQWHNITLTFDGNNEETGGSATAFLDGNTLGSIDGLGSALGSIGYQDLYVGGTPWGESFEGTIDNVRISQSSVDLTRLPEPSFSEAFDQEASGVFRSNEETSYIDYGKDEALFGTSETDDKLSLYVDFTKDEDGGGRQRLVWNTLEYGIEFQDDDLVFWMFTKDNGMITAYVRDTELADNQWHRVGFTLDEENGAFRGYLDGEMVAQLDDTNAALEASKYWHFTVGGTGWGETFAGQIDNLTVYKDLVTAEEHSQVIPDNNAIDDEVEHEPDLIT